VRVSGLVVDGQGQNCADGIRIFGSKGPPQIFLVGVVVEDNRITHVGGKYMFVGAADGYIVRWNEMDGGTGTNISLGNTCSAIYLGSWDGSSTTKNGQIYANNIRDAQCEGVDIKISNENNEIHHNIFDNIGAGTTDGISMSGSPNTGVIAFRSLNNRAHDNIMRRYKVRYYAGCVTGLDKGSGNQFYSNVCRDSLSPSIAIGANAEAKTNNFGLEINNNTWCSLSSSSISSSGSTFRIYSNNGLPSPNAAASACDAEEVRILAERDALPGNLNGQSSALPLPPSGLVGIVK
jgi:hypothetical protein